MTSFELRSINWKKDALTTNYVRENADDLLHPEKMSVSGLCDAITYCVSIDNPYSVELLSRAGYLYWFNIAKTSRERMEILREAAMSFRIILF